MTINLDNITLTDDELERIALRVEQYPPDEAQARYNALVNAAKVATIKQRKQPTTPRRTK